MDEAEKYKQRMEAIAEKRRQLEEQDRARREMEDEKLRLQQLKRKSLRDQWLMEGAPLSPASPDPQVPRSPLWDNENQRWPSETQQLAGEEEKLKEQVADGQTQEAVKSAEDEVVQDAVVRNGDSNAVGAETEEHEVKTSQCPVPDEAACVLTNGNEEDEEEEGDAQPHVSGDSSEQNTQATRNGPLQASENAAGAEMEAGSGLDVSEEGLGHIPNNSSNAEEEEEEEEEEGTLVMRAECVIITDEGDDDATEEPPPGEGEPRTEEDPRTIPEAAEEGVDDVEEMIKADVAVEALQESGECIAAEPPVEDGSAKGDAAEHIDEITDKVEEAPVLQQSATDALEGAPVAPVPVYSESQPSVAGPEPEAVAEAPAAPEEPETLPALKAEGPPAGSGQFQDVPLVADPRENHHRTEEHPLLSQAKAPEDAQAEAEAPASSAETRSANTQETPKQKSCQCCTVM